MVSQGGADVQILTPELDEIRSMSREALQLSLRSSEEREI